MGLGSYLKVGAAALGIATAPGCWDFSKFSSDKYGDLGELPETDASPGDAGQKPVPDLQPTIRDLVAAATDLTQQNPVDLAESKPDLVTMHPDLIMMSKSDMTQGPDMAFPPIDTTKVNVQCHVFGTVTPGGQGVHQCVGDELVPVPRMADSAAAFGTKNDGQNVNSHIVTTVPKGSGIIPSFTAKDPNSMVGIGVEGIPCPPLPPGVDGVCAKSPPSGLDHPGGIAWTVRVP